MLECTLDYIFATSPHSSLLSGTPTYNSNHLGLPKLLSLFPNPNKTWFCFDSSSFYCSMRTTSGSVINYCNRRAYFHLFLFSQGSQSVATCHPMSKNHCSHTHIHTHTRTHTHTHTYALKFFKQKE